MPTINPELEARLLAAIPDHDGLNALASVGINESTLEHYGPMLTYMSTSWSNFGYLPSLADLIATFNLPKDLSRGPEEFLWLLNQYREVCLRRDMQNVIDSAVRDNEEPQMLISAIISGLMGLYPADPGQLSITDRTLLDRLAKYDMRHKTQKEGFGIPTGIQYFDVAQGLGWQKSELGAIIARTYMGKTFMLMYFGIIAWEAGNRVLFISPELDVEEAEARFDAMYLARSGAEEVSLVNFYRGFVPSPKMFEIAEGVKDRQNWVTVGFGEGTALTLAEIDRLIREHHPHLVLVDGISLLGTTNRRQQLWETILELSTGLKNIAKRHRITILCAHQANRSAKDTSLAPALHEVAFGDGLVQVCDTVMALHRDPGVDNQLKLTIQKRRRVMPPSRPIEFFFQPSTGLIQEAAPVEEHAPAIISLDGSNENYGIL